MSICIVTHCYAQEMPQYAAFLQYQLSSLVLHKPKVPVRIIVCYTHHDSATHEVLLKFLQEIDPDDLCLYVINLHPNELFRRCIGRNRAALASDEDVVWFTDVDHVFGEGCLDDLQAQWQQNIDRPFIVYPKMIKIHQDHATGDEAVQRALSNDELLIDIEISEFTDKKYSRAIGGVQIVSGDDARKYGYLKDDKHWQRPRTDGKAFGDFRDDLAFRRNCSHIAKNRGQELQQGWDIKGVYRLRHSTTTYQ